MTETPGVLRMRRPSWRDPRLGLGVMLVAASVALGSWFFSQADRTVEVYAATEVLVPGQVLGVDDLGVVSVHLGDVEDTYLTPQTGPAPDAVMVRTVGTGELIPAAAVGAAGEVDLRPVTIPVSAATTSSVQRGGLVDVWVAREDPDGRGSDRLPPEMLLAGARVADVSEDASLFAGGNQVHVELLVAEGDLADVLEALSSGAQVYLVRGDGA